MNYFFLLGLFLLACCVRPPQKEIEKLSFYKGYRFLQEESGRIQGLYDLSSLLAGMQAFEEGKPLELSREALFEEIASLEKKITELQLQKNLEDAEDLLDQKAKDPMIFTLVPKKLLFEILETGSQEPFTGDHIEALYKVHSYRQGEVLSLFEEKTPKILDLSGLIDGFRLGVKGMLLGEKRCLYIHPDLAYKDLGGRVEPNTLLIIEVKRTS